MKRLIIGDIPFNFKPCYDEVFAPYCFIKFQNQNSFEFNFKTNLNLSSEEKRQIDLNSSHYTTNLIKEYIDKYNSINGLNFSFKFWNKILYSWLISLVQHTYERELQLRKFINFYKEPFEVKLVEEKCNWNIDSTKDFHDLIYSVEYNEWIVSRLIEKLAPENWKTSYKKVKYLSNNYTTQNKLRSKINFIYHKIFKRTNKIYGVNLIDQIFFEILLRLKKPLGTTKKEFETAPVVDFTLLLSIDKLINYTEPNFLKNLNKLIHKHLRKYSKGKIVLGGSQYLRGDDDFKVRIGLAIENGELFIGTQHGGDDYGLTFHCEEIFENEFNNFSFITWGWEKHAQYKTFFKRLPSPYLLNFKNKHKLKNNEIILVGTRAHLSNRFLSAKPSENQWIEYRNNKLNLLRKLHSENLQERVFYKPFPNTYGSLEDKLFFEKQIPDLKIINSDFHKRILNCSLLIIDHPGTTLNIAMAANIPTILFWDKNHFPLEKKAEKYLKQFELNNMFFENYIELSEFILKNNISKWWNSNQIKEIRNKWCSDYAYTNKYWKNEWSKFLIKI